ncbi:MAG: lectin like domain-containing protein, partial [Coriobacteriia bacterium]|nr:lectin like domain-containing protein [Coriobacteriia bacterium]
MRLRIGLKSRVMLLQLLLIAALVALLTIVGSYAQATEENYDHWIMPPDPPGTVYGTGLILPQVEYPPQPLRMMPFAIYPDHYPPGITHENVGYTLFLINQRQSPVKNQGSTGLCWSFASMAAIEAATIKAGGGVLDLSEVNAGHALSIAGGNTVYGFFDRTQPGAGGNPFHIMKYSMRDNFGGQVNQADDDEIPSGNLAARPLAQTAAERRSFAVPGIYHINTGKASIDEIKAAVTNYGSVTTGQFGDSGNWQDYFNASTAAYYLPPSASPVMNHLVLIVGWDDSFPRTNFNAANRPANDGAWLVKNSWGTGWGMSGYFWISYEDKYAGEMSWVFDPATEMDDEDFTNKLYDYNSTDYGVTWAVGQVRHGTNVFTAGPAAETLQQVRVYVNSAPQYNIPIYLTNNYTSPTQVAPVIAANQPIATFDANYVGYHTIDIPSKPTIAANARFAITVRYENGVPSSNGMKVDPPMTDLSYIGIAAATQDISVAPTPRAVYIKAVTSPVAGNPSLARWTSLTANGAANTNTTTSLTLNFDQNIALTDADVLVWGATKGALTGSGSSYQLAIGGSFAQGDKVTVVIQPNGNLAPEIKTVRVNRQWTGSVQNVSFTSMSSNGTANTVDTTFVWMNFNQPPQLSPLTAWDYANPYISVSGATLERVWNFGTQYQLVVSNITVGQGENLTVTLTNPPGINITPLTRNVPIHRDTNISWSGATADGRSDSVTSEKVFLSFSGAVPSLTAGNISVTGATAGALTAVDASFRHWQLEISDISVANGQNINISISGPAGYTLTPISRNVRVFVRYEFPPLPLVHYTTSGLNAAGWAKDDFVITATPGYQVSRTNTPGGLWTDSLSQTAETSNGSVTFYVRNTLTGDISAAATETYRIDRTSPSATVRYRENALRSFLNTVSFGLFFSDQVDVTIVGSDAGGSGVAEVVHYRAASEVVDPTSISAWTAGTTFSATASDRFILYVRVTDVAGNVTILLDSGVVVFTNSQAITDSVTHARFGGTAQAQIALNGNSIDRICDGNRDLVEGDDYTLLVEDVNGNGSRALLAPASSSLNAEATITFSEEYLESLSIDTHTLTIYYQPLGESFTAAIENDVPNTTEIELSIEKASDGFVVLTPENIIVFSSDTFEQTYDLAQHLVPIYIHPAGAISYSLGAFDNNAEGTRDVLAAMPTLEDSELTYTGLGRSTGAATLEVIVSSDNYADVSSILTFEAQPRRPIIAGLVLNSNNSTLLVVLLVVAMLVVLVLLAKYRQSRPHNLPARWHHRARCERPVLSEPCAHVGVSYAARRNLTKSSLTTHPEA